MLNWKMSNLLHLPYFWVILSANINSASTSSLGNHFSKHSFSYYLWTDNSQSCLFAKHLSPLDQIGWFSVHKSTVSFILTVTPFYVYKTYIWTFIYHLDHSLGLCLQGRFKLCRFYLHISRASLTLQASAYTDNASTWVCMTVFLWWKQYRNLV